jgi:N-hydroxyarylamine O-acetyltransferase
MINHIPTTTMTTLVGRLHHLHYLLYLSLFLATTMAFSPSSLSRRYFKRLKLDPSTLDEGPTLAKLATIIEAQLKHIPFENLAQHGAGRDACLDILTTAVKILDNNRGGFCYEVNSLLSEWLSVDLGYNVVRVPAIVYSKERGYDKPPSHICMIITIDNDPSSNENQQPLRYFIDVGFGEPAMEPLKLECGVEHKTIEGMVSRFVRDGDTVGLEWLSQDTGGFEPRVRFGWLDAMGSDLKSLSSFAKDFEEPYKEASPFVKKIVCCRVTRTHKYTVAGHRLKVTTPRFGTESKQTVTEIESTDEGRAILKEQFGIPLTETEGLKFEHSKTAAEALWMTF